MRLRDSTRRDYLERQFHSHDAWSHFWQEETDDAYSAGAVFVTPRGCRQEEIPCHQGKFD